MANPQKENGYVPIANEIYDALCHIRIAGEARQVLDVIIRKTYGFQKKKDCIALSQYSLATGLSKIAVRKSINKLICMNIITQKGNDLAKEYSIIKDYSLWKPLPKKVVVPKKVMTLTQKGTNRYPKRAPQKTITKDNVTKDREKVLEPPKLKSEIVQVIDLFKEINPSFALYFGRPPQRESALRLFRTHGIEKLTNVIGYVKANRGERYIPTIQSPYDLEEKWAKLESFAKRERANQNNFII